MKKKASVILSMSIIFFIGISHSQEKSNDFSVLNGPYLGQEPPGMTPEVFAPEIVSTISHEFSCCFSPDGKEFYFTRKHPDLNETVLMVSKLVDEVWTEIDVAPFVNNQFSFEPWVTPDNKMLYFQSGVPIPGQSGPPMNVLYVERQGTEWGEPKNPGPPFNPAKAMHISSTIDGTIYTTDISGGPGTECLGIIKKVNGEYLTLEKLGYPLDIEKQSMHPYVSADESYLIFGSSTSGQISNSVLFCSFKKQDGNWTVPIEIDLGINAGLPFVTSDGKYLFFTSGEPGEGDIYWVDAKIFKELKPVELKGVIAYSITAPDGNAEIFLMNSDGSEKTQLTDQPGRLYGAAFSPDAAQIAFYNHFTDQTWSLYKMDADGNNIQQLTHQQNVLDWSPDWSPYGKNIVFARSYASPTWRSEIWVMNSDGSHLNRLGNVEGQGPDWSPDGSKIVYFNYVDGGGDISVMNADGSNPIKLTDNPSEDWWPKFSPDGSKIVFQSKRDGNFEIYTMSIDGSSPVRLTNNSADDEDPNWSPDGTRLAFISMRDGHYEIYNMNADGSNQTRITNTNGHAIDPDWKPITDPSSVKESGQSFNSTPQKFQLFQNYPNPFNAETILSFELKIPTKVTIQIFDVLGKEIKTLIQNEFYHDGHYSLNFNVSDLSSGIYFYKMYSDHGFTQIKKMCLMK